VALVRTKLRRRVVAMAFVLATVIGIGAVGAKPAAADQAICGWTVTTTWSQGGFRVLEPSTDAPIYLHTYFNGQWLDIPWGTMFFLQYWGVWYLAWGSYFFIPDTGCWAPVA
jgi:hypothetical protein